MSNEPFENDRTRATEILELIHTDLNGPHNTIGYCGEKYFVTFIDDYSKCAKIYCIKNKSKTASCFFDYINLLGECRECGSRIQLKIRGIFLDIEI